MSKRKQKLTPDVYFQGRLNSNDENFKKIMDILARVYDNNRNRMVLDGLRQLANVAARHFPEAETKPDASLAILSQFDILNERIDAVISKLNRLQEMGFSPQIINAAMDSGGGDVDPALQDEIRAQFLANNS